MDKILFLFVIQTCCVIVTFGGTKSQLLRSKNESLSNKNPPK